MNNILSSGRTKLELIEDDDFDYIYDWLTNFDYNLLWTNIREFPKKENFYEFLKYQIENEFVYYFIIKTSKNERIGTIFIHDYNKIDNYASISAFILPFYQNKFYGVDSYKLVFDFVFKNLPIRKFYLDVFEYNINSIKLIEKIGFKLEGVFIKHRYYNGVFHNVKRYSLFMDDWISLKEKLKL